MTLVQKKHFLKNRHIIHKLILFKPYLNCNFEKRLFYNTTTRLCNQHSSYLSENHSRHSHFFIFCILNIYKKKNVFRLNILENQITVFRLNILENKITVFRLNILYISSPYPVKVLSKFKTV